ncbi:MAG: hypothetical protein E7636_05585 [Ruminococcaceae bacterium]|nr:hypothetical protein [Oscillospiraceae bacterium]
MCATKKAFQITCKITIWLLVTFTVLMMIFTVVTVATVDKNERSIFGFRFYVVRTDSMSLSDKNTDVAVHFNAGDIVIVKNIDEEAKRQLQAGDVITFMSVNSESYGETVTHMIREVKMNSEGKLLGYVTYGTNTGVNDEALVEPAFVMGVYQGKLAGVGKFFAFVRSIPGYITCVFAPFLLLILYNSANVIRLFRRYKREQEDAIQAERDKVEAERTENERMLRELEVLKAQLEKNSEEETPSREPASEAISQKEATDET